VAAATGPPQPVPTASPRNGWRSTRALRWAVPAGSVYLLQFDGDDNQGAERRALDWAADVHGTAYRPEPDDPADDKRDTQSCDLVGDRLRTAGFGVVLTGVWI
jgi:CRISPR-associated protein Cmr3